jgi:5-methylcytosine-specific restriction endonuclease McrA
VLEHSRGVANLREQADVSDRTCAVCENPSGSVKYCSDRCRWTMQNRKRYKRPKRACPGCGVDLSDRHGQVKYCSNACRRWIANGNTSFRIPATECAVCSFPMEGKIASAIYCGRKCKSVASEKRRVRDDSARYLTERERRISYALRYSKEKPHVGQAAKRKRRARLAEAGVFEVSGKQWRRLVSRHGGRCFYCGVKAPMTMDHVLPIIRGGVHSIGNLIPACARCNSSKRHRTIMEWRLSKRVVLK